MTRPPSSYSIPGYDLFLEDTIPDVIKAIFRLKNLRRAEGVAGQLTGFTVDEFGTQAKMFLDDTGCFGRRAGSMILLVRSFPDFSRRVCADGLCFFFAVRHWVVSSGLSIVRLFSSCIATRSLMDWPVLLLYHVLYCLSSYNIVYV